VLRFGFDGRVVVRSRCSVAVGEGCCGCGLRDIRVEMKVGENIKAQAEKPEEALFTYRQSRIADHSACDV
jgi:hypothetical protein